MEREIKTRHEDEARVGKANTRSDVRGIRRRVDGTKTPTAASALATNTACDAEMARARTDKTRLPLQKNVQQKTTLRCAKPTDYYQSGGLTSNTKDAACHATSRQRLLLFELTNIQPPDERLCYLSKQQDNNMFAELA